MNTNISDYRIYSDSKRIMGIRFLITKNGAKLQFSSSGMCLLIQGKVTSAENNFGAVFLKTALTHCQTFKAVQLAAEEQSISKLRASRQNEAFQSIQLPFLKKFHFASQLNKFEHF